MKICSKEHFNFLHDHYDDIYAIYAIPYNWLYKYYPLLFKEKECKLNGTREELRRAIINNEEFLALKILKMTNFSDKLSFKELNFILRHTESPEMNNVNKILLSFKYDVDHESLRFLDMK